MWKRTSFGRTAVTSRTGTFTRPKLTAPVQIDLAAMSPSFVVQLAPRAGALPGLVDAAEALRDQALEPLLARRIEEGAPAAAPPARRAPGGALEAERLEEAPPLGVGEEHRRSAVEVED